MTRFTLYHTVTDTLGRVHGLIYTLDDGRQRKAPNDPVKANESVIERGRLLDSKLKARYEKRSELRRKAKGSDPPRKSQ